METKISKEELVLLGRPFSLEEIYFKPQGFRGNNAQALVHATPRAYIDRLNEVFGSDWSEFTDVVSVLDAEEWVRSGKEAQKPTRIITKTILNIRGTSRSALGEDFIWNDNVATTAEAQSFKRAATYFGCGSYLYNYKNIYWEYDRNNNSFVNIDELKKKKIHNLEHRFWEVYPNTLETVAVLLHYDMDYTEAHNYLKELENSDEKPRQS